jgi:lipopolysaccharide export system protein LptA
MTARQIHGLTVVAALAFATLAHAQPPAPAQTQAAAPFQPSGPPNALQGFAQNRDQPVKIDAGQLEVRDKDKVATFSGNVKVVQGDTTMKSKSLAVFYDGEGNAANTLTAAKPGPTGQQRIRRLEAKGGVKVCQNEQTVTGDDGIFDMQANTVMVVGNVVLTQGQNVLTGARLTVNLTTGEAKIDGGGKTSAKGGVSALLFPAALEEAKKEKAAEQAQKQQGAQAQKQQAAQHKPAPCT